MDLIDRPDTPPRLPLHPGVPAAEASVALYRPDRPTGAAVVVLPGGGYGALADHEGEPVARWLNGLGIAAAVCRYRHSQTDGGRAPDRFRHPVPLSDAARAVRRLRADVDGLGVDPARVGVLGFSAGGHLAATACNAPADGDPGAADPTDRASGRPDLAVLCYPVILMGGPGAHLGSQRNLAGPDAAPEAAAALSAERGVTAGTPPTFLFHTADDAVVPPSHALRYADALARCGVPFELHVYAHGRHGVGLAAGDPALATWADRCADWLRGRGFAR